MTAYQLDRGIYMKNLPPCSAFLQMESAVQHNSQTEATLETLRPENPEASEPLAP